MPEPIPHSIYGGDPFGYDLEFKMNHSSEDVQLPTEEATSTEGETETFEFTAATPRFRFNGFEKPAVVLPERSYLPARPTWKPARVKSAPRTTPVFAQTAITLSGVEETVVETFATAEAPTLWDSVRTRFAGFNTPASVFA